MIQCFVNQNTCGVYIKRVNIVVFFAISNENTYPNVQSCPYYEKREFLFFVYTVYTITLLVLYMCLYVCSFCSLLRLSTYTLRRISDWSLSIPNM